MWQYFKVRQGYRGIRPPNTFECSSTFSSRGRPPPGGPRSAPAIWCSSSRVIPSPWVTGFIGLLLTNRTWQKQRDLRSTIRSQESCLFLLGQTPSPALASREASAVVSCSLGRSMWQGPSISSQEPVSIWGLWTSMWVALETEPPPVKPLDNCDPSQHLVVACEGPWARGAQVRLLEVLTHRNCEMMGVCCFKLLGFGVVCHSASNNEYTYVALILLFQGGDQLLWSVRRKARLSAGERILTLLGWAAGVDLSCLRWFR